MLTALRSVDAKKVIAHNCQRWQGPFTCSCCGDDVMLVKGSIRVHHFRHRADRSDCLVERGESAQHRDCKEAVYRALLSAPNTEDVDIERRIGDNIADVFAVIDGVPVAIEIQRSKLPVELITQRTLSYHARGVFVLWIGLPTDAIAFSNYSPSAWERWCHATYGGKVFYWLEGETILPVHFDPQLEQVPEFVRRSVGGDALVAGGYARASKRFRSPNHGPKLTITESFRPIVRRHWEGGSFVVPRCSIYVDRGPIWWTPAAAFGQAKKNPGL